jgi:uncharacterized protein
VNQDKNVIPLKGRAKSSGKCPNCAAATKKEFRPFCSRRCADLDLGRWLKEDYRIPSQEEAPDTQDGALEED